MGSKSVRNELHRAMSLVVRTPCGHHPRRPKLQVERRSFHQYSSTPQPMVPVALPSALQGNFELPVEVDKMPVDENDSNGEKVVRPGIPGSGNSL